LFQVSSAEIATLFDRAPVVLKEDLDYDTALKDKADFEATGALCRLEAQHMPTVKRRPQQRSRPDGSPDDGPPPAPDGHRFGLRHACFLSFYSRPFYRDVMAHWRGLAFVHLLLVMLLSAAVYTLHFHSLLARFIAEEAPAIVDQVPDIMIDNGRVRVEVAEPYTVRLPESGVALAVIDTTGQITSLNQTEAVLLLTSDRLAARLNTGQSRVLDLRQIESLRIDRNLVTQWLLNFQNWAPFILFPLSLGISSVLRIAQAMLYGGIGLALAALHRVALPYSALVAVAVMAMTPFLLLDALLVLLAVTLPLWGLIGFLMAMAYLVFGIRATARRA
jgi:hypothetical protein